MPPRRELCSEGRVNPRTMGGREKSAETGRERGEVRKEGVKTAAVFSGQAGARVVFRQSRNDTEVEVLNGYRAATVAAAGRRTGVDSVAARLVAFHPLTRAT